MILGAMIHLPMRYTKNYGVNALTLSRGTYVGNMMEASKFIDYYEILEISPNANSGTIERMFRYLAQRYHPDNPDTGDRPLFDAIMEAYDTLRDPIKRAQYDIEHKNHSNYPLEIGRGSQRQ